MDLILRNARLIGAEQETTDIGITGGRIAAIQQQLAAEGETHRSRRPARQLRA